MQPKLLLKTNRFTVFSEWPWWNRSPSLNFPEIGRKKKRKSSIRGSKNRTIALQNNITSLLRRLFFFCSPPPLMSTKWRLDMQRLEGGWGGCNIQVAKWTHLRRFQSRNYRSAKSMEQKTKNATRNGMGGGRTTNKFVERGGGKMYLRTVAGGSKTWVDINKK